MGRLNRITPAVLLVLSLSLAGFLELLYRFQGDDARYAVSAASSRFRALDGELITSLKNSCEMGAGKEFHRAFLHDHFNGTGISIFLFDKSGLIAWSNNAPSLAPDSMTKLKDASLAVFRNGDYWVRTFTSGDRKAVGLLLMRTHYPYENRFLKNTLNPSLGLPASADFSDQGVPLKALDGKTVVKLSVNAPVPHRWMVIGWWLVLAVTSLGLLLAITQANIPPSRRWFYAGALIAVRVLMAVLHVPSALYESDLFSPSVFAVNTLFNSPGDLFLNGLVLLLAVISVTGNTTAITPRRGALIKPVVVLLVLTASLYALVEGLVMDASVSFDVTDLSGVGVHTLFLLFSLCLYLLTGALIVDRISSGRLGMISFGRSITVLCMVSAVVALLFFRFIHLRDMEHRERLAKRVTTERDPVAEYQFKSESAALMADTLLYGMISRNESTEVIKSRIRSQYMKDFMGRFDWTLAVYDSSGRTASADAPASIDSLRLELSRSGKPTESPMLFALPADAGRMRYCAVIPLPASASDTLAILVLQLRSTFLSGLNGFPELLASGTLQSSRISEKYSFAHYSDGTLSYEFGQFPYPLSPEKFSDSQGFEGSKSVEAEGFDHLVVSDSRGGLTVVSRPVAGYLSYITLFSWLFAFFGTFTLLANLAARSLRKRERGISLTRRIRISVFSLVILAFVGTGSGTVYYILRKYDNDQRRNLGEQLNGLWVLLGDRLGLGTPFSELEPRWLSDELGQITGSTNIDFNLFDEKGRLFYSSQPRLYEQGILSELMDPEAYHELNEFGKTQFIRRESIGELGYLAAYAPFVGPEGNTTGYLHLPYFEKQYERSREVSGFLSALFNIYILLLAAAVFVTLFISSRVTRPLALIQERLSAIRFGKRNEAIVYPVNDEIGQLVNEYNRMVRELADSADRLARSERESAWREMAKQVAHEIKNPLTPMRLSIQHLQRVWAERSEDREALTQRMAQVLIEQIDTLSHIATEFSNFAKMPSAMPVAVDLKETVDSSISLFSQSYPHEFRFHSSNSTFVVSADKEQLQRVFSNLLKNAVQAIPDGRKGRIDVRMDREPGGMIRIEVEDNGTGIATADRSRIFVPNFTTKSGGTGLGLAMVKNIVEQGGGSVSFESREGEGTVFTVRWPEAKGIM